MNPSDLIWGLVCGIPSKWRRNHLMLMFKAYLDESNKGDPNFFVLAGYVARAENWANFSDEWQELLDMRSPHYRHLDYFKMNEMRSAADRERCAWFYRVIEKHVMAAVSCVVDVRILSRLVDEILISAFPGLKGRKLRNPYYFGFLGAVNSLAYHGPKVGISSPIDFILDEATEKVACVRGWDGLKETSPDEIRSNLGSSPYFRDDKKHVPLQAADLWAWWVRHWIDNNVKNGLQEQLFPWSRSRTIPTFHVVWDEAQLRRKLNSVVEQARQMPKFQAYLVSDQD